jgi:hypothetical protein
MLQDYIAYVKNAKRMYRHLILVENHVTDIPERLKEIDPNFFVMFNPKTQKYEVHKKVLHGITLEVSLPFGELDSRAIDYVSSVRDAAKVRKDIEEHNVKIDEDRKKVIDNESQWKAKEIFDYAYHNESKERPDAGAFSTRQV